MKTALSNQIKEVLSEIVGECLEPTLTEIHFRTPEEIREALQYLADEIEGLDEDDIFVNLVNTPDIQADEFAEEED